MKGFKKLFSITLSVCMLLCLLVATSCGGNGNTGDTPDTGCQSHIDFDGDGACDNCNAVVEKTPCESHTDEDGDGYCDDCDVEIPVPKYSYTITLKGEDGSAVPNAQIQLMLNGEAVETKTTDAQGTVTGSLAVGDYTLVIENLPENWYSVSNYTTVTIGATANAFEYEVIDNTPNGTVDKPFPAENAETGLAATTTFPVGASYVFTTKGGSRYLVINSSDVKVTYEDKEYLPSEGVVRVLLKESVSTNAPIFFTVTSIAEAEVTVTLAFESVPGTAANPYEAELDKEITASVVDSGVVHYSWTATKSGFLVAKSTTEFKGISLYNTVTFVASIESEGAECTYLYVNEGDLIDIKVTLEPDSETGESKSGDVVFTLGEYTGAEDNPLPLSGKITIQFPANGTYYFVYEGDEVDAIIYNEYGEYLNATLNGTEVTLDNGECCVTLANGSVLSIRNTMDSLANIVFEIYPKEAE